MYSSYKYIELSEGVIGLCEVVQLFSVVYCVVRNVHKFEFRLAVNEAPTYDDRGQ